VTYRDAIESIITLAITTVCPFVRRIIVEEVLNILDETPCDNTA